MGRMAASASTGRTWRWFIAGVLATTLVVGGSIIVTQTQSNGTRPGAASSSPSTHDVVHGRFVKSVMLDGGVVTVTPAPASVKPTMDLRTISTVIWTTSQIAGYRQQVLGFGLVTITKHFGSIKSIRNLPAWIGFATVKGDATSCPAMPSGRELPKLPPLPSAGEAVVVVGDVPAPANAAFTSPPAVDYVARSAPCGALMNSMLEVATEQVSVPWVQNGPLRGSDLHVTVSPPACGWLSGSSSSGSARSVTVSIDGQIPEQLLEAFCPRPAKVNEVIHLGPPSSPGAPPPLVTSTTRILHGQTGPIRATR